MAAAWTPVGPLAVQTPAYGAVTGRVTAVAIDPADTTGNTVFVGTSGGGVWKSTGAAGSAASVSFTPLTDTLPVFSPTAATPVIPSLSIGALTVQPGNTGVVLAGTGDPNDAADSYYGAGLLRSADHGATWSLIPSSAFLGEGFAGFAWNTASPTFVVAAISSAAESATVANSKYPSLRGLYYSTDSGLTWSAARIQDGSILIQYSTSDSTTFRGNAVTAVVWNPVRKKFYAAIRYHGYYESVDGRTYTRMANQPGSGLTTANCPPQAGAYGSLSCPIFRGALAVQPVTGDMFALTVDSSNADGGLWQDTCSLTGSACASSTVTWGTQINTAVMDDAGNIDQGDYNLVLAALPASTAASPTDTLLFAGAADLYRCSLAGGCNLRNTTNATTGCAAPAGVAPAQHAIAWQVNLSNAATPRMFFGNDGGLWRSLDGVAQHAAVCSPDDATHFDNLNSGIGSLAEVVNFASHPTNANTLLVALGGLGSAASNSAAQSQGTAAWTQMGNGESGAVAISQKDGGSTWLAQNGGGVTLHACTNGSSCTAADFAGAPSIGYAQVSGDESLQDPAVLLDPALNSNAVVGTCRVWRGPVAGGSAWSASNVVSPFLGGSAGSACTSSNAFIRSLAAGGANVAANGAQNNGSPVLYAGLAGVADGGSGYGGHLFATTAGATATSSAAWSDQTISSVTNDTANRFNAGGFDISSVVTDPSDATGLTVYATVMGFGYPHIYRSTNGGASWLNITANLPNAPANSVAVDPNMPHVVYVALDTGVYATQDVTTCTATAAAGSAGACWSVMGTALPNAPVLSLVATGGITAPGASSPGVLRAGTFGRGIWQMPLLTAGAVTLPAATLSPTSLSFAATQLGATSVAQIVNLTNSGNAVLQVTAVTASAGFAETDTCTNATLTVNASCSISVKFVPATAGAASSTLTISSNVSGGSSTVALSGTGTGVPSVSLSPTPVTFASTAVGSAAASQIVTATNSGTAAATLSTPAASADFNVTNTNCGTTLAINASCSIAVNFAPSQVGPRAGTLLLADSTGTHTATLNGTATGAANMTWSAPASFAFGDTVIGGHGQINSVTISNTGNAPGAINGLAAVGDYYLSVNTCTAVLAPGASCSFRITFAPAGPGTRPGTVSFSDGTSLHTVSLTGTGLVLGLTETPATLSFAPTAVGSISAPQTITVANNTPGYGIILRTLQVPANFAVTSNTCPSGVLVARSSCIVTVVFAPLADGALNGTLPMQDSYSTNTIALAGTGHGTASVGLSASSVSFGSVVVGASASQMLTVTNSGSAAATLAAPVLTGDYALGSSSCTASLAVGASCVLNVTFTPSVEGTRNGTLLLTDGAGSHSVSLTGSGSAGDLGLSASTLAFANSPVGTPAAARSLTVTNTGSAPLMISAAGATGDFVASGCMGMLAVGHACTENVTFTPTAAGSRTGMLTFTSNSGGIAGTQTSVPLSGSGMSAFTVVLLPTAVNFGSQLVGTTSAVTNITISNTGMTAGALGSIRITGDFRLTANTCGTSLPPQTGCTVSVVFAPTTTGTRTGTLTVMDDAGTQTASLTGVGAAAATDVLSPLSLSFATTQAGTASATQAVTLTNSGDIALTLVAAQILTGDFTVANACGPTVAAHTSCAFNVAFAPRGVGPQAGTLQVSDVQHVQTVALGGTGIAGPGVSLLPASLTFANTGVGGAGAGQVLTVTNNGGMPLQLKAITPSGDFGVLAGSSTCSLNTAIPVGASCVMSVAFVPTVSGVRTGSVVITSNAATQTAQLSGTGVDFSFAANGISSLTIASGSNAVYPLLLRPAVNTADPVTFACTGMPANSTCKITSQYGDLSATGTVTLTVLTGVAASAQSVRTPMAIAASVFLLPVFALPWCTRRRRFRGLLLAACAAALLLGSVGCGANKVEAIAGTGSGTGGSGGGGTSAVTPSGTYIVTASATAAGVTHTVPLTLVVQ